MLTQEKLDAARRLGPVVIDLEGTALSEADRRRLLHPMAGMVILFARNFESKPQLQTLTSAIRSLRPGMPIAVDHEGGRVQRFREGFTAIPAMGALAAAGGAERLLAAAGYVIAAELGAAGVDMSFAPVLDIEYGRSAVIATRALGTTPDMVARRARAFIGGLAAGGFASCGKHFPGHGWAEADSHLAVPLDDRPREAILADAEPYRALSGVLDAVMTGHIVFPALGDAPATYLPEVVGDLLRGELGFSGLVFSDDLSMAGAGPAGTPAERALAALRAGCDMVLHCNHPDELDSILDGLQGQWRTSEAFACRLARLLPDAGARPAPETDPRWQAARALLDDFR